MELLFYWKLTVVMMPTLSCHFVDTGGPTCCHNDRLWCHKCRKSGIITTLIVQCWYAQTYTANYIWHVYSYYEVGKRVFKTLGHCSANDCFAEHDDVIKWKHFPRYWPFVWGIHRGPVNSPHKGQWRGALMFSMICVWINGWVNNGEVGDLRRYRAHYDVTVMNNRCHYNAHKVL